jgi:hypothetical protein
VSERGCRRRRPQQSHLPHPQQLRRLHRLHRPTAAMAAVGGSPRPPKKLRVDYNSGSEVSDVESYEEVSESDRLCACLCVIVCVCVCVCV